ncbi:hypothetical protein PIROE2DRAFT_62115, partial [Piromyces sp. E2]
DLNMLKIFTLGTRFSDLVHKIQQEDTPKKLYISNVEKPNIPLDFNTLDILTNQSIVNNLNSQIDAILLSVIDNDKNGLNTSQRLAAQNLLIKKSTAPLVRSIFISEYLSGRNMVSPNNEFKRRLCVLLDDSELIRFISSLVDSEKMTRNDQDILNRILIESSLTDIIYEDQEDVITNDNNKNNNSLKISSEEDDENTMKQYGQILRTIYAASKKASSQEKMIENFVQRTSFLIETTKKNQNKKKQENFFSGNNDNDSMNLLSNSLISKMYSQTPYNTVSSTLQQQQQQQQQLFELQQRQLEQQKQLEQQRQMEQQRQFEEQKKIEQQKQFEEQMKYQQLLQQQNSQQQQQQQQQQPIQQPIQQQQQIPIPHTQIHSTIPGAFSLESRNFDKSANNKQKNYGTESGLPSIPVTNSINPLFSTSSPSQPPSQNFEQSSLPIMSNNHQNLPETPITPTPQIPTPLTPILQQQQVQANDSVLQSSPLNFNSLNL